MQAVILAAGKSTRTYPLTVNYPKALLKIANKTILEHSLDALQGLVDEVILVVGFKKELITQKFGSKYKDIKLTYVEQKELNGPGGAIQLCEKLLKDKFLVMNGDDIYSKKDIEKCIQHKYCVMSQKIDHPERWGIFEVKDNKVISFEEKPKHSKSNLGNIGVYVFNKKVFEHKLEKTSRNEYEITDYITFLIKKGEDVYCEQVSDYWLPVGYPWHILEANEFMLKRIKKSDIKGTVEQGATIKGVVVIGEGTLIRSGTYIKGPVMIGKNCVIGPNCYIRPYTTIADNCKIGNASEVKNSVCYENTGISHLCYVGDSVIGMNTNLGGGTITANLRHDNANVKTLVKDELVDSGRRKFGTVIGENVHTGIHTSIYPGRKIWPDKSTLPGEAVKKDIK